MGWENLRIGVGVGSFKMFLVLLFERREAVLAG
jgi:hypothetical protein